MSFPRSLMRARALPLLFGSLAIAGCASTGATFRSGVGDAFLEHAPWYAGAAPATIRAERARLAYLPVQFQHGATQPAQFDPSTSAGSALDGLLKEMNAYLDSLAGATGVAVRFAQDARAVVAPGRVEPDVQFGCITQLGIAGDDCQSRGDSALGRGSARMRLAVARPSPSWISWMAPTLEAQGADQVLMVRLEVGSYLVRQRGLGGRKEVDLGTGHTASLPWLTALETPVQVLQLTGALVGRDGRAVRIGAEGILAKRTRLLVSAVGGVELLGEEAVSAARAERRDDLPGAPLAWQVALGQLVAQLTGASVTTR